MVQISISVRHGSAASDLQAFTEEKCERLEKFLRDDARVELVVEKDHVAWKGEVILHGSRHHERFVAHDTHADVHACIEKLIDKLARQLGKSKEKRKDHHGPPMSGEGKRPAPAADEPSFEDVVRRDLEGGGDEGAKKKK